MRLSAGCDWVDDLALADKEDEMPEARHGEKMISVTVKLWTNGIADEEGHVLQRHAWTAGIVHTDRNESHGIPTGPAIPFESLMDLMGKFELALRRAGITLHPSQKMATYTATDPTDAPRRRRAWGRRRQRAGGKRAA